MGILRKMSAYDIEHAISPEAGYDDEIMCAGWNPSVALARQQLPATDGGKQATIPAEPSVMDTELFLQNIYASMS